jgi:hypothetical protein
MTIPIRTSRALQRAAKRRLSPAPAPAKPAPVLLGCSVEPTPLASPSAAPVLSKYVRDLRSSLACFSRLEITICTDGDR